MSELLISFLGQNDVDSSGNLDRAGPLFRLVDSKRFKQVWLLTDRHTKKAAEELAKSGLSRVRLAHAFKPKHADQKEVRVRLYEFVEVGNLMDMKAHLEQKLLEIIGANPGVVPNIHLSARLCSTVSALTLLVCSGRIEGKLIQVQEWSDASGGRPVIAELATPAMRDSGHLVRCSAAPQSDELTQIATSAERVGLVGTDRDFNRLLRLAYRCSQVDGMHMLISGAPGTGKVKMAHFIHALCDQQGDLPLVEVDCSLSRQATADLLFERQGSAWAKAGGGILLLAHVDALTNEAQGDLYERMQRVDFKGRRVIVTSSKVLPELVSRGEFRNDLLGLFKGRLELPLLKQRKDVSRLADHFLELWNASHGKDLKLSPVVKAHFRKHVWPANLTDLRAAVEGAADCAKRTVVNLDDLGGRLSGDCEQIPHYGALPALEGQFDLQKHLKGLEAQIVQKALKQTGGNQTAAAALLCMKKGPMRRCIAEYGLSLG